MIIHSRQLLKEILAVLLTMLLAVGVVYFIAWRIVSVENRPNGFDRVFFKTPSGLLNEWHSPVDVTGIEGFWQHLLILKTKVPGIIWVIDPDNKGDHIDTVSFPQHERAAWSYQYLTGDSSMVIAAGNVPALYFSGSGDSLREYRSGNLPFTRVVRISGHSFITRGFDKSLKGRDQVFIRENTETKERIINDSVFPLIDDAGLSTDGNLHFDQETGLLNYVSFYNNNLVGLDTNLNIIYHTHTIDSVSTGRTNIGSVKADDLVKYTNSGPKKIVNTDNCTSSGLLYNRSLLKADNEDGRIFRENGVVDVYIIKNGAYLGSMYIPYYKREAPMGMKVTDHSIFVLYKNNLIQYSLPEEINQFN